MDEEPAEQDDIISRLPGDHFRRDPGGKWRDEDGREVIVQFPPRVVLDMHPGPMADAFRVWWQRGLAAVPLEMYLDLKDFASTPELLPYYRESVLADLEWEKRLLITIWPMVMLGPVPEWLDDVVGVEEVIKDHKTVLRLWWTAGGLVHNVHEFMDSALTIPQPIRDRVLHLPHEVWNDRIATWHAMRAVAYTQHVLKQPLLAIVLFRMVGERFPNVHGLLSPCIEALQHCQAAGGQLAMEEAMVVAHSLLPGLEHTDALTRLAGAMAESLERTLSYVGAYCGEL